MVFPLDTCIDKEHTYTIDIVAHMLPALQYSIHPTTIYP